MAVENANTYELNYGVKVIFDQQASVLDYARMRMCQLEALNSMLCATDLLAHPDSLLTDVLWLASSLSGEMKELVEVVYRYGQEQAQVKRREPAAASY